MLITVMTITLITLMIRVIGAPLVATTFRWELHLQNDVIVRRARIRGNGANVAPPTYTLAVTSVSLTP